MVKKTKPKITQTVKRRRVYWLVLDANGEQSFASYVHIEAIVKLGELNSVVHGPNHAKARRIGNAYDALHNRYYDDNKQTEKDRKYIHRRYDSYKWKYGFSEGAKMAMSDFVERIMDGTI
jgi:hypothetical protein